MTGSRPFTFDVEFGDRGLVTAAPESSITRRKRVFVADEVEAMCAEARREGETSAVAQAAEFQARALAQIAESVGQALSALAQAAHEHKVGAADLALAAARKIAGGALERFPEAPIQAALEALTREIEAQPRLIVRLAGQDAGVEAAIEEAARDGGFSGQVVFRPGSGPASAAFALEWGDGKAEFDPQEASDRIAEALKAALAAEGLHGEAHIPTTPAPGA